MYIAQAFSHAGLSGKSGFPYGRLTRIFTIKTKAIMWSVHCHVQSYRDFFRTRNHRSSTKAFKAYTEGVLYKLYCTPLYTVPQGEFTDMVRRLSVVTMGNDARFCRWLVCKFLERCPDELARMVLEYGLVLEKLPLLPSIFGSRHWPVGRFEKRQLWNILTPTVADIGVINAYVRRFIKHADIRDRVLALSESGSPLAYLPPRVLAAVCIQAEVIHLTEAFVRHAEIITFLCVTSDMDTAVALTRNLNVANVRFVR